MACQIPVGTGAKEAEMENPFEEFFSTAEKMRMRRVAFLSCIGTVLVFFFDLMCLEKSVFNFLS